MAGHTFGLSSTRWITKIGTRPIPVLRSLINTGAAFFMPKTYPKTYPQHHKEMKSPQKPTNINKNSHKIYFVYKKKEYLCTDFCIIIMSND